MCQEHAYSLAVRHLLHGQVHCWAQCIRLVFSDIRHICNHLSAVICHAVDIGAIRMDVHVYTYGSYIYVCVYLYLCVYKGVCVLNFAVLICGLAIPSQKRQCI